MTADLVGLVLINCCFLVAGAGVTCAVGWWRSPSGFVDAIGLSYLCGVATYGVLAQLLYVLGASLARWEVIAVCAVPAAGLVRARPRQAAPRSRPRSRFDLLALPIVAILALFAVDLWFQPLWAYDSWTFWTPKAHALYALGLDPGWFTSASLVSQDYPILLPAVEAAGFHFTGYETSLLDVQSWMVFTGFVAAIYQVGARRGRPIVLWAVLAMLVLAPTVLDQLAAAEADIPVAVFFATAGLCAWSWLVDGRAAGLPLAAVLGAGAAATKVEGTMFVIALFLALGIASARASARRSLLALGAGAAALAAGALPWRIWIHHHHIANQASFGRVTGIPFLVEHASRLPVVCGYVAFRLVDPRAWLLLLPVAAVVGVESYRRGRKTQIWFAVAAFVFGFVGIVLAYWSTPYSLHYQLATSARRVVTGLAFLAAALTPLLAGDPAPDERPISPRVVRDQRP